MGFVLDNEEYSLKLAMLALSKLGMLPEDKEKDKSQAEPWDRKTDCLSNN